MVLGIFSLGLKLINIKQTVFLFHNCIARTQWTPCPCMGHLGVTAIWTEVSSAFLYMTKEVFVCRGNSCGSFMHRVKNGWCLKCRRCRVWLYMLSGRNCFVARSLVTEQSKVAKAVVTVATQWLWFHSAHQIGRLQHHYITWLWCRMRPKIRCRMMVDAFPQERILGCGSQVDGGASL